MDKSWMKLAENSKGRLSPDYTAGVFAFLKFANGDREGKMRCPCEKCMNAYRFNGKIVGGHLIAHGIMQTYTNWYYHGENLASSVNAEDEENIEMKNEDRDELCGIDVLLEDNIRAENIGYNGGVEAIDPSHNDNSQKFDKLLKRPKIPRLSRSARTRPEVDPSSPDERNEMLGSASQVREDTQRIESSVPSLDTNLHSRGLTQGLQVQPGDASRFEVPVPSEWNALIVPHTTRFVGELSCRVRQSLPRLDYDRWSSIPASDKTPILTSVKQDGVDVVNRKLSTYVRQHKYRLLKDWQRLVDEHGEVYARSNPPRSCTADQWTNLIDNSWTTTRFQGLSSKYKVKHAKQTVNHTCGSRSLAGRAHETTQMIIDVESQFSHVDAVLMTSEEMYARYHCTSVIKGIGNRPSMSMRSIASSSSQNHEEHLNKVIKEQGKMIEEQRKLIEKQQHQIQHMEDQQHKINSIEKFLRSMGYKDPPPPPPDGSAGCSLAA